MTLQPQGGSPDPSLESPGPDLTQHSISLSRSVSSEIDPKKLEQMARIRAAGITPYPDRFSPTHTALQAKTLPDGSEAAVAGRLKLWRPHGGLVFATIEDQSGSIQISLRRDDFGERFAVYKAVLSLGDIVGVSGKLWTTRTGERTVGASEVSILSKCLRPLPDKWHGVVDEEIRLRKRWLDMMMSSETRDRFVARATMLREIRSILDARGFVEVETPILQDAACGASARPFTTHHNALDRDFFLRISPETYLKRVVAGGIERVYELGRNFRNEGIDRAHLQEFTMLEWYAAYWNYADNIKFAREMVKAVVEKCCGSLQIESSGIRFDFGGDWATHDYRGILLERSGVDLRMFRDLDSLKRAVRERGLELKGANEAVSYGALVDLLYKRTVRPALVQPTILVNYPLELVPLARRSDSDPNTLDMFQFVVNGWEICKGYSELVDPIDQERRLQEQAALRGKGDDEAMMLEPDFLECMQYGMPPMSGVGLGVDRLLTLITNQSTIRQVVLFPNLGSES